MNFWDLFVYLLTACAAFALALAVLGVIVAVVLFGLTLLVNWLADLL